MTQSHTFDLKAWRNMGMLPWDEDFHGNIEGVLGEICAQFKGDFDMTLTCT